MVANAPEYQKAYYEKNKDKIQQQLKEKYECEYCGRSIAHQNLIKHQLLSPLCQRRRKIKEGKF
jgi:ribosomal protein L37AE/L43A